MSVSIERRVELLNPKFGAVIVRLHAYLIDAYETGRTKTRFEIFETYRGPLRQADLITKRVTKAGPWQSAHQFGLAADLVPFLSEKDADFLADRSGHSAVVGWNWHSANDYRFLSTAAKKFELATPVESWDPCHVEHPRFPELRKTFRTYYE